MKRYLVRLSIGCVVTALLLGCQVEEEKFPQPVELITPEDGSSFKTSAPAFVWSPDPLATSYILKIIAEGLNTDAVLVQDTLTDTLWEMTGNMFSQFYKGSFEWTVAPLPAEEEPLWSVAWGFSVDKTLPEPEDILISPEDGAVFTTYPPIFRWKSVESASSYVIRMVKDAFFTGDTIIEDTLNDTTYTMSQEKFETALNADYVWSVAPVIQEGITWREFRGFTLDKPMPELNLDTTYFPAGLDYEWVYERHLWGYDASDPDNPDPPEWDYHDTLKVRVTDSVFGLNGWEFYLGGYLFRDVYDTVYIFGNRVLVFGKKKIPFNPDETGPLDPNQGVEIIYSSDTLNLAHEVSETWEPFGGSWSKKNTTRIKTIGVIAQLLDSGSYGHMWSEENNIADSLLYFIKGQDTVWRREEP